MPAPVTALRGSVASVVPARDAIDTAFFGLNRFDAPAECPPGFLVRADNVVLEGGNPRAGRGGILATRPGRQGVLSAAQSGAQYALTPVVQSDGTTDPWWVNSNRLWRRDTSAGATSATEVLLGGGSFALDGPNTFLAQTAGKVYVVDGTDDLARADVDGTGGEVSPSLSKPSKTEDVSATEPEFSVVSYARNGLPGTNKPGDVTWNHDYWNSGTTLLGVGDTGERNFTTDGVNPDAVWNIGAGASIADTMPANGDYCLTLGTPGEEATTDAIVTPADTASYCGDGTRYPKVFRLESYIAGRDTGQEPSARVEFRLKCYTDAAGTTGEVVYSVQTPAFGESGGQFNYYFDCRDFTGDIRAVKLQVYQPFEYPGSRAVDINHVDLTVPSIQLRFTEVGTTGSLRVSSVPDINSPGVFFSAGQCFEYVFSGAQNYAREQKLTVTVAPRNASETVRLRLFFRDGTTVGYAPDAVFNLSQNLTKVTVDISQVPEAARAAADSIGFVILNDLTGTAGARPALPGGVSGVDLFDIVDITLSGNLTPGLGLYYRFAEIDRDPADADWDDIILSDGSDVSNVRLVTPEEATNKIYLPGRTNSDATHLALYRFGDEAGGTGRLVAVFPYAVTTPTGDIAFGADAAKGLFQPVANPYVAFTAPGVANEDGGYVLDNTPASFLLTAPTYEPGREAPPSAPRRIVEWKGRIWLAVGDNELWGSWDLAVSNNAAVYFTRVPDLTDPALSTKGFFTLVGTKGGRRIAQLVPLEDRLIILMETGRPYILLGTDPTDFALREWEAIDEQMGCIAPRTPVVFEGGGGGGGGQGAAAQVVYLTQNGLKAFNASSLGGPLSDFGRLLDRDVNPEAYGGSAIDRDYLRLCACWIQGEALHFAAPTSGDTANTVVYRYDGRQGAWTRWQQGNLTGGCAGVGTDDPNLHFAAGLDGMLYRYVPGQGDKTTSAASATAITQTVHGRAVGLYGEEGQDRLREKVSARYYADLETPAESVTATLGIAGEVSAADYSLSYSLGSSAGRKQVNVQSARTRGETLQPSLSYASAATTRLRSLGLSYSVQTGRYG